MRVGEGDDRVGQGWIAVNSPDLPLISSQTFTGSSGWSVPR